MLTSRSANTNQFESKARVPSFRDNFLVERRTRFGSLRTRSLRTTVVELHLGHETKPPRERLQRQPLRERADEHDEEHRVEDRRAALDLRREGERREHDRDGAAQPGPREEDLLPQ